MLCARTIRKGSNYHYEILKPWSHPDNDGYTTFKAHTVPCYRALLSTEDSDGWVLPDGWDTFQDYLSVAEIEKVMSFAKWEPATEVVKR